MECIYVCQDMKTSLSLNKQYCNSGFEDISAMKLMTTPLRVKSIRHPSIKGT